MRSAPGVGVARGLLPQGSLPHVWCRKAMRWSVWQLRDLGLRCRRPVTPAVVRGG